MIEKRRPWRNQVHPARVTRVDTGLAEWQCSGCKMGWVVKGDEPGRAFAFWPPDIAAPRSDDVLPLPLYCWRPAGDGTTPPAEAHRAEAAGTEPRHPSRWPLARVADPASRANRGTGSNPRTWSWSAARGAACPRCGRRRANAGTPAGSRGRHKRCADAGSAPAHPGPATAGTGGTRGLPNRNQPGSRRRAWLPLARFAGTHWPDDPSAPGVKGTPEPFR
jgi:hypothetical protein